ncbi:MAG: hypothetical protein ACP5VR_13390 [Acidimicrobiales bacterium]
MPPGAPTRCGPSSITTVTWAPSGTLAHRRSRSAVVVVNFHPDQMNLPCSSARLA